MLTSTYTHLRSSSISSLEVKPDGNNGAPANANDASSPVHSLSVADRVVNKLDEVRRLGRARRLRIQLPLGVAGTAIGLGAALVSWTTQATVTGRIGMAIGPTLVLLSVLPTEPRVILVTIVVTGLVLCFGGAYHAIPLVSACAPAQSVRSCTTVRVANALSCSIQLSAAAYAFYLGLGLVGGGLSPRPRWLPSPRPPRSALEGIWRCWAGALLCRWPAWVMLGTEILREPVQTFVYDKSEVDLATESRAAIRFVTAGLFLVLGLLSLSPRLRGCVHARLASMGEGVSAAAGLAALLGSHDTAELLALGQETFRTVRCDQLLARHLRSSEPASDAYLLSAPARLGSCDAFLSHSWQDNADEKWRLLQVWRASFVRANGREPRLWIDRCCIDPGNLTSLLPCLCIYLAGCDKLLALRGPTYLTRLWCVVELYAFFEMGQGDSASRIQIIDYAGLATYGKESEPAVTHLSGVDHAESSFSVRSHTRRLSLSMHMPPRGDLGLPRGPHGGRVRVDVRHAKCTVAADEERMLAVIESCGAGIESFNAWLHALLIAQQGRQWPPSDAVKDGTQSRRPKGRLDLFMRHVPEVDHAPV